MGLRDVQAGGGGARGAVLRPLLSVLAAGWGAAQVLKSWAYRAGVRRAGRLPVPVISVGNLVAGGTGKTPFVAWLVERLRAQGKTPGVLSRGYGPRVPGGLSDEGAVLEHVLGPGLPQVEDPDRLRGGVHLLREHPHVDVVVLDDGFQHRRIHRDLDIVLLDAANPFGFERLLPRGLLRERPGALARAGAVVLTRVERASTDALGRARTEIGRYTAAPVALARTAPVALEVDGQRLPVSMLAGAPVLAVSGLGDPAAFEETLARLGARVVASRRLSDHRGLTEDGWARVADEARRTGARWVVVTRKDAVKGPHAGRAVLDVATEVLEGAPALDALVDACLPAASSQRISKTPTVPDDSKATKT